MDVQTAGQTMGKDDFLRLFVTQMRSQNPLNPMDSAAFTAQLAQFSSLEQLTNIGSQLKDLLVNQNSLQNTLTTSFIGRNVRFTGDKLYLKDKAEISYALPSVAAKVKITVSDSAGKVVREINLGPQAAGNNRYTWDGRDSQGTALPEGSYGIKVEAVDAEGKPIAAESFTQGVVTGVTFENNVTCLIIDGKTRIQLSDIKEIS